jgi:hypothetical protein
VTAASSARLAAAAAALQSPVQQVLGLCIARIHTSNKSCSGCKAPEHGTMVVSVQYAQHCRKIKCRPGDRSGHNIVLHQTQQLVSEHPLLVKLGEPANNLLHLMPNPASCMNPSIFSADRNIHQHWQHDIQRSETATSRLAGMKCLCSWQHFAVFTPKADASAAASAASAASATSPLTAPPSADRMSCALERTPRTEPRTTSACPVAAGVLAAKHSQRESHNRLTCLLANF